MEIEIKKPKGMAPLHMRFNERKELLCDMAIEDSIRDVVFLENSFEYLNNIYNFLNNRKMEVAGTIPDYLKLECSEIYRMLYNILMRTHEYSINEINFDEVAANDILFFKVPAFFGEYHYFLAAINETFDEVIILQSFGASIPFNRKIISFPIFNSNIREILRETTNFDDDYARLSTLDDILFGYNYNNFILVNHVNEDEDIDYDNYDDDEIEGSKKLGININHYSILKTNYKKRIPVEIFALRLEDIGRQIRKRKKSKKLKSKNAKKRTKRTRRTRTKMVKHGKR